MKIHICDCCGRKMQDIYRTQMKVFYYVNEYDFGDTFPFAKKKKIELCHNCFEGLKEVAKRKGESDA